MLLRSVKPKINLNIRKSGIPAMSIRDLSQIALDAGEVRLERMAQSLLDQVAHGAAAREVFVCEAGGKLAAQLLNLVRLRDPVVPHDVEQVHDAVAGRGHTVGDQGALFRLVLGN